MHREIYVTRPAMPPFEEYCAEIRDLWDTRQLTNMGEKHRELEEKLKAYLHAPHLTLFANGHLALESAIGALGLSGEIITTPFTFASTTHAIVRSGCTPVFCDIDPDSFAMDVSKIELLITEKTSALLPVHVYGHICDVESIRKLAQKYRLRVLYDAAHAFGVERSGVSAANFGDAAVFSFHATKVFTTVEGGAVTYADPTLEQRLNDAKNYGIRGETCVAAVGGNAKLNELQAAMGICNLRHMDEEIERRAAVSACYRRILNSAEGIVLPEPQPDTRYNYVYFPVLFRDQEMRERVYDGLRVQGIFARRYFYPLTTDFACYRGRPGFDSEATPVAKSIAGRVLTLPLYGGLALDDAERIARSVLNFLAKHL